MLLRLDLGSATGLRRRRQTARRLQMQPIPLDTRETDREMLRRRGDGGTRSQGIDDARAKIDRISTHGDIMDSSSLKRKALKYRGKKVLPSLLIARNGEKSSN